MPRWFFLTLFLLMLSVLQGANVKYYKADQYAVDMYLQNDGTVRIAEEVTFQFTGGPFRFVTRDVPNAKVDGLLLEKAAMDSAVITDSSVPNYYTLSERNGLHLKWYYSPLKDETHSFFFQYIVNGIYTLENGMVHLLWKPLPSEYEYIIDKAIVRVHLPKEIQPSNLTFGGESDLTPNIYGDSLLVYEYSDLVPNTVKRVDLLFAENLIPVEKPNWISNSHRSDGKMGTIAVCFVLLFVFIIFTWVFVGVKISNRYSKFNGEDFIYEEPPSTLEPALLSRLLNGSYSYASSVYANLVSLAQRGVVKIQSLPKQKWYEVGGSMGFEYIENVVELTPTEQIIVECVFGNPPKPGTVKLLELQKIIQSNYKYLQRSFEDSLIKDSLLDPFQMEKRKRLMTIGLIVTFLDFAILFGALAYFKDINFTMLVPLIALFIVGNIILMIGALTRILTDAGIMETASWNAFSKFLRKKMKEPMINGNADDFNRIFPYALVMNLGREWVTYFKKHGIDVGAVWLESDSSTTDSWTPYFFISTISSPSSSSSSGGGSSGGSGGGGGGGGSSAG